MWQTYPVSHGLEKRMDTVPRMEAVHCTRCGREPRPEEFTDLGQLVQTLPQESNAGGSPFGTATPWARLDDKLICPSCQSQTEAEIVAFRLIEAIEEEIERLRQEGVDPTRHESALIAYGQRSARPDQRRYDFGWNDPED